MSASANNQQTHSPSARNRERWMNAFSLLVALCTLPVLVPDTGPVRTRIAYRLALREHARPARPCTGALHNALDRFARAPFGCAGAVSLHARVLADNHGLSATVRTARVRTTRDAALSVIASGYAFSAAPSVATYGDLLRALAEHGAAFLRAQDARKGAGQVLPDGVHAPERDPALVRYAAPGSLDWQTHPAIGVNPMYVAALAQQFEQGAGRNPNRDKGPVAVLPDDGIRPLALDRAIRDSGAVGAVAEAFRNALRQYD